MNPWPILGAIIGWTILAIVAVFLAIFIVMLIVQSFRALAAHRKLRARRRQASQTFVENSTGRTEPILSWKQFEDEAQRVADSD